MNPFAMTAAEITWKIMPEMSGFARTACAFGGGLGKGTPVLCMLGGMVYRIYEER